jgi:polysaccharide export outer membrane protein
MLLVLSLLLFYQAAPQVNFILGPDDVIDVQVFQVPDLNRTVRIDQEGFITVPLLGTVRAEGFTPSELEQHIAELLGKKYVNDPNVSIFVKEYKSHSVSVLGAVRVPGVYQIPSPKPLVEILSMAQGLADAGSRILVTHAGKTQEIEVMDLLHNKTSLGEVPIQPGDQVRVLPAEVVYILGDVERPGSYPIQTHQDVNVLQGLALAGGPKRTAKMKEVVIFRTDPAGTRAEIPVRLNGKLTGPDADRQLEANDIVFVPGSVTKRAFSRALDLGLNTGSGLIIWRRY